MSLPQPHRPRRLRRSARLRENLADIEIRPKSLIYPVFVGDMAESRSVDSMPGIAQWPVEEALAEIHRLADQGIGGFIIFGVTPDNRKDSVGSYAADPDSPVNRLLAKARESDVDALLIADACFCEYTDHGHCGVLTADPADPMVVDNDATLANLAALAVAQAKVGADMIAPSGMMDGQVAAIRAALDDAGRVDVPIMSYAVKYASSFYGPFRDAGGCSLSPSGQRAAHRKSYQMDYRRSREWQSELEADLAQGADVVMVKPAGPYLDIVRQVRDHCSAPVAAYQVSGEYAMLHAAADKGALDLKEAALESVYAIRRAGADWIVTYFAPQLLDWL